MSETAQKEQHAKRLTQRHKAEARLRTANRNFKDSTTTKQADLFLKTDKKITKKHLKEVIEC